MSMQKDTLPILEKFISFQGEGLNVGMPYMFIRTGGCPLRCRFCDSEYTWNINKKDIECIDDITKWIKTHAARSGINWVSITGGEPLLYPEQLKTLLWSIRKMGLKSHIETSGRFYDQEVHHMCDMWSMDIKTPCTNECKEDDFQFLHEMRKEDQIKCLIENQDDLIHAMLVHEILNGACTLVLQPFNVTVGNDSCDKIGIMKKFAWLADEVRDSNFKWTHMIMTPQLHVLAFGNQKAI